MRWVLSIYDLIPVLYPHWFDRSTVQGMDAAYRSLEPEDWAICMSEATRDDLCSYTGIDPRRTSVIYPAAAPELFYPVSDTEHQAAVRAKYGIAERPYLLSLNTLEPRKNMDHAIRAFVRLIEQERLPDLCLVLVGATGWKYEKIFAAINAAGALRERIILAGYVADEDLASLYSGCYGFVYPSFYEGFGLPPLEAMQCGVPVITSNTSSLPEVVGDAGIMLDPTDEDGLAHAMLELYRNPTLRETMRAKSLTRAKEFSWERCTRETLAAYRRTLAG